MNTELLRADLRRDEGRRLRLYDDATGKDLKAGDTIVGNPTIGDGVNLAEGIADAEADLLTVYRISQKKADLDRECPWWVKCPDDVQRGLLNLAYNEGAAKLLKSSPRMMACIHAGDYAGAARELLDGPYKGQVGERATRIAQLFRNCATQGVV